MASEKLWFNGLQAADIVNPSLKFGRDKKQTIFVFGLFVLSHTDSLWLVILQNDFRVLGSFAAVFLDLFLIENNAAIGQF